MIATRHSQHPAQCNRIHRILRNLFLVLTSVFILLSSVCASKIAAQSTPTSQNAMPKAEPPRNVHIAAAYGRLPLTFEANIGQTDSRVKFLSRGVGQTLFLTSTEAVLDLTEQEKASKGATGKRALQSNWSRHSVLRMKLLGADRNADVAGLESLPGKSNYFIGNDPKRWHTNVPTFAKVHYSQIYPGIDLVYYGSQRHLEYDFVVAPGAHPEQIALAIEASARPGVNTDGDVVLHTEAGEILLRKPHIYQELAGQKKVIPGDYALKGRVLRFDVAAYDHSQPLIIDPVVSFSTFLGNSGGGDAASAVAADASGVYITGVTASLAFPGVTSASFKSTKDGPADAFIAKLNPTGTAFLYATYLGGAAIDTGLGIAVDGLGNAYVTGSTQGSSFPLSPNPILSVCFNADTAGTCAFATELNPTGSSLLFSTYLRADVGSAIAVDPSGNAYVTGQIQEVGGFPATATSTVGVGGAVDVFVSQILNGGVLGYATYIGGSGSQAGLGIAVDRGSNAYVTGFTTSVDFPVTANSLQTAYGGGAEDAFAIKLNSKGNFPIYSTYLGGAGLDENFAIAVDSFGAAYMTGDRDGIAVAMKLNPTGSGLDYSTDLTTGPADIGNGVTVNSSLNAFIVGTTGPSLNTANPIQSAWGGGTFDAFVSELDPNGNLIFSTYLGGNGEDLGTGIAMDISGAVYVVGESITVNTSNSFPVTAGAMNTTPPTQLSLAPNIGFVAKFGGLQIGGGVPANIAATAGTPQTTTIGTAFGTALAATVSDAGGKPLAGVPVTFLAPSSGASGTFSNSTATISISTNSSGVATAAFTANSVAGVFTVTAQAGASGVANFSLTNVRVVSSTLLLSSLNPSAGAQSVQFSANVTGVAGGTPTGSVTFFDGAAPIGSAIALSANGLAIFTTSTLTVGSHSITAQYSGDSTYNSGTSNVVAQTVTLNSTSTTLLSSLNPSASGQSVQFSAIVSSSGGGAPAGTVTFFDGAAPIGSAIALNGNGLAIFTTSTLAVGAHSITAQYAGNANFGASASTAVTQTVGVNSTFTLLGAAPNPSTSGQPALFAASVFSLTGGIPTGAVAFFDNGMPIGSPVTLTNGVATITATSLSVGSHPITATYTGSTNFGSSTSAVVTQTVVVASTGGGAVTPTFIALASSPNPSPTLGQSITITAQVMSSAAGTPTGNVIFSDNGATIGTTALNGSGVATFSTTSLTAGTHPITAQYSGDANFGACFSSLLSQSVGTTTPVVGVQITPIPQNVASNGIVQFSATVQNAGTNTSVTWQLTGVGALDSTGKYTAPSSSSTTAVVTVSATPAADPSKKTFIQFTIAADGLTTAQPPASVTSGSTLSIPIQLAGVPTSSTVPFTLSCGNLPVATTCVFNPPTVTGQNPNFTVMVVTSGGTASSLAPMATQTGKPWYLLFASILPAFALAGLRRGVVPELKSYACCVMVLVCLSVVFLASCSGYSSTPSVAAPIARAVTPSGSYQVVVTATPQAGAGSGFVQTQLIVPVTVN